MSRGCCHEHRKTVQSVLVLYRYRGKTPVSVKGMVYSYNWQQDDVRFITKEDEHLLNGISGMVKIG